MLVFLLLIPNSPALASSQCYKIFDNAQNTHSFSPLLSSNFETNLHKLTEAKEVDTAFQEIRDFIYKDEKLSQEYLDLKSSFTKNSYIPYKNSDLKFDLKREDGEVDRHSYLKVFEKIENELKNLHPDKVKTVSDLLTMAYARKNNNKIDYTEAEALENLYRKVTTNSDAMRGKPKISVSPTKILKDAARFMKNENTKEYTKEVLLAGAIVDLLAVLAFRFMEMSPGEAYFQTQMLFYFAQSYVSFQVMQLLVNPVYTNHRLTHKQSFAKTYVTSVAVYTMFVPIFRFLHDQFLGSGGISVPPSMLGVYAASMFLYALVWKYPNEIIFRKILSPLFFDHFLSPKAYKDILDVKNNSTEDLISNNKEDLNASLKKLEMLETLQTIVFDELKGNMNGDFQTSYRSIMQRISSLESRNTSRTEWIELLEKNFGITENSPRIKHPDLIERDVFALKNQIKGLQEQIKWTEFFRKNLAPGEPVSQKKRAFYFSYKYAGRIVTASVMISAFIVGQNILVGGDMLSADGFFSNILSNAAGINDQFINSNFGN